MRGQTVPQGTVPTRAASTEVLMKPTFAASCKDSERQGTQSKPGQQCQHRNVQSWSPVHEDSVGMPLPQRPVPDRTASTEASCPEAPGLKEVVGTVRAKAAVPTRATNAGATWHDTQSTKDLRGRRRSSAQSQTGQPARRCPVLRPKFTKSLWRQPHSTGPIRSQHRNPDTCAPKDLV